MQPGPKLRLAPMCPAIRQTTSPVLRQPEDRTAWDPATCRARPPAMTALPGRTAARQTLPAATTLRRPTIGATARTARRRRGHRSRIRQAIRAAQRRSPRRYRAAVRKVARIAAVRRPDTAQRPRSRGRRPDIPTMRRRPTRLPPTMERAPRAHTAEVAMDRLGRMAAGARDRTPHRTLPAGAVLTAGVVVVTVAAAVVDTEDNQ